MSSSSKDTNKISQSVDKMFRKRSLPQLSAESVEKLTVSGPFSSPGDEILVLKLVVIPATTLVKYCIDVPLFVVPLSSLRSHRNKVLSEIFSLVESVQAVEGSPYRLVVLLDKAVESDYIQMYRARPLYPDYGTSFWVNLEKATGEANWKFRQGISLDVKVTGATLELDERLSCPLYDLSQRSSSSVLKSPGAKQPK